MELQFADHGKLKKQGRSFDCATCPVKVQEIRRCREDKWNFTAKDGNVFPIRVQEGGGLYGFCPGKVTWDHEAMNIFEIMVTSVEMKKLLVSGGIADQPGWFVSLLTWFAPLYDTAKFASRVKMVLGDSDSAGKSQALARKTR